MTPPAAPLELAYYQSDWIWPGTDDDKMKSYLLFFDGLALALPEELLDYVLDRRSVLAQPLWEQGLLHNFDPDDWMTEDLAKQIRNLVEALLAEENLQTGADRRNLLSTLTASHFVAPGESLTAILEEVLKKRIITAHRADRIVSLPPYNKSAILAALAVIMQAHLQDASIQPVTTSANPHVMNESEISAGNPVDALLRSLLQAGMPETASVLRSNSNFDDQWEAVEEFFRRPWSLPQSADIFRFDAEYLHLDLSRVPLDDVLAFRTEHGSSFRSYAQHMRGFIADLQIAPAVERRRMLSIRAQELAERAQELNGISRSAFGRATAATAISMAGAVWTARQGDLIGALLAGSAAAAGFSRPKPGPSPYTYIMEARHLG
ncbi:hypothetical protein ACFT9M_01165 [Micromonospora purpureochromogenes]|uniref:hypothetical protein n=1 Tax=Micromonospora purpureochromogenes TaxID=47872 RepID=UPI00362D8E6C